MWRRCLTPHEACAVSTGHSGGRPGDRTPGSLGQPCQGNQADGDGFHAPEAPTKASRGGDAGGSVGGLRAWQAEREALRTWETPPAFLVPGKRCHPHAGARRMPGESDHLVVLGGRESRPRGEGGDGGPQPAQEPWAGQAGPESTRQPPCGAEHPPSHGRAAARLPEEPGAEKPHAGSGAGGVG